MKVGQRINLIKKLAKHLAEFGFSEGNLILRQFGLPWSNGWSAGEEESYFLSMLEKGQDEQLVELHEYLFPEDTLPGISLSPRGGNWSEGSLRLFLSHSSKKKLLVTQIKQELLEYGVESFVAHEDIEPTKEWLEEIKLALNTCHAFVAILCSDFKSSNYCDQEVGYALQRGLLVVPVRVKIDPYGFMAPLQGVSAFEKEPVEIAKEIKKLLALHPTTKPLMMAAESKRVERLVNDFLCSSNYPTSTALLKKLEAYDVLPIKLVEKIKKNWEKNDQIYGCRGIPRRMEDFFKYHARLQLAEELRK